MKSLFNIVQKPYPLDIEFKSTVKFAIGISLFIVFFVYLFQMSPWNAPGWYKWMASTAFGVITFLTIFLNRALLLVLLGKNQDDSSWTVLKEISWIMWNFFTVGCFNFLFAYWMNFIPEVNLNYFIGQQFITLIIGIIPVSIFILIEHNRRLQKKLKEALSINQQIQKQEETGKNPSQQKNIITLPSQNQTDPDLSIQIEELLYITSEGNYLNIFIQKENQVQKEVIRNTLKNIYPHFESHSTIFQCHRAFIVNTTKIKSVDGNAQGYRIHLEVVDEQIPVSRSYVPSFRDLFINN